MYRAWSQSFWMSQHLLLFTQLSLTARFQADFIFLTHMWLSPVLLPLHEVLTSCSMTLSCLSISPPYLLLPQSSIKRYSLRKIFSHLQISQIDAVPLGNLISVVKLPSSVWWRKNSLPHQTVSSMMADNCVFVQFYIPNTYYCAWTKPKLQLTHAYRVRGGDGESRKMEPFQDHNKIFMKL